MADWIAMSVTLLGHPKFVRLQRRLQLSEAEALLLMYRLWTFAFNYAPDGDLSHLDEEELAVAVGALNGDATKHVEALLKTGFLERKSKHLVIHDWAEYGGRLHNYRAGNRSRQHKWRKKSFPQADDDVTSPLRNVRDREIERERESAHAREQPQETYVGPMGAFTIEALGGDPFEDMP